MDENNQGVPATEVLGMYQIELASALHDKILAQTEVKVLRAEIARLQQADTPEA